MRNTLLTPEELFKISHPENLGDMAGKLCDVMSAREIAEGQFNLNKPWGVELQVREDLARVFMNNFFDEGTLPPEVLHQPIGPKLLAIASGKRLSWHVHHRKDAFLRVLAGRLNVYTSPTDDEVEPVPAEVGELIHIPDQIRHRLGSVAGWSLVAEISRNVYPWNPTDEKDERRIKDDFGRVG